jgi:hypothetical protein
MAPAPTFLLYGLRIHSDLDLGLTPTGDGIPDVTIRFGPARALAVRPVRPGCFEARPRHLFIGVPGGGVVMARDGNEVWVDPGPGMNPASMVPTVLGQGLAALLHQRGTPSLRASAVVLPTDADNTPEAVAFVGGARAGKSALAAAMIRAGATLVSDDVLPVESRSGTPTVISGAAFCALSHASLNALGVPTQGLADMGRVEPVWRWPAPRATGSAPLRALYVLESGASPRIERLDAGEAFETIARHSFAGTLALVSGSVPATLGWFASLLRSVPVYRLTRPHAPEHLAETAARVAAHRASVVARTADLLPRAHRKIVTV